MIGFLFCKKPGGKYWGGKEMGEKKGLTHDEKRELAWKLHQELLEAIPGEPQLYEVEMIMEEMQAIIHARATVPKVEE